MFKKLSEWWYWTGRGIAMMLFFIVFFGASLFAAADYVTRTRCESYGFATETPIKYVRHTCYVKLGGRWHDREDLRVRR